MAKRGTGSTSSSEDRHEQFAQEYLIDLNPSAAYRRVYGEKIAPNTAWSNGYSLLRKTEVAARIAELKRERIERLHIEQDRPVRQLLDIVESDVGALVGENGELRSLAELDDRTRGAVASVKVRRIQNQRNDLLGITESVIELKFWDKVSAARTLMQHMGMLTEKHEVSGPNGGPIRQEVNAEAREAAALELLLRVQERAALLGPRDDPASATPPGRAPWLGKRGDLDESGRRLPLPRRRGGRR